jgi:hypothetical protein
MVGIHARTWQVLHHRCGFMISSVSSCPRGVFRNRQVRMGLVLPKHVDVRGAQSYGSKNVGGSGRGEPERQG